jgi:hypothetical protein
MAAKKSVRVGVSVSVADDHLDKIQKVKKALQSAGMEIEDVLEAAGVITGSAKEEAIDSLEGVKGVTAVERSQTYQLPPPDSDVQ